MSSYALLTCALALGGAQETELLRGAGKRLAAGRETGRRRILRDMSVWGSGQEKAAARAKRERKEEEEERTIK